MGRNRFQAILGNLHFIDSLLSHTCNQDKPKADKDPMERIRPVSDYLREKIQQGFNPHQKLVIDESLCLWRGNIGICQYIPSKRHRYGLKTFVMCDCKSGYVQDVLLYMGSKTELEPAPADILKAGAVVCTLMKPYLNEGRILYTDNWYTSPSLCAYLGSVNTDSCGTVRRNRKHLPPLPSAREADSKIYKHANGMLLLSWMDNKEVNVLSTVHEPVQELARRRQRGTGIRLQKPQAINDYNVNMRLVDKKDQVVASAECARKTMRWHKKFFFHLLDLVLYNSNIVYKELTGKVEHREEFCTELARELIIDFKRQPIQRAPFGRIQDPTRARLNERHFIALIPPTELKPKPYRRCHVCSHTTRAPRKRSDTRYYCRHCDVGLCITPCFEDYHTKLNF
ncbi:piggyBac transposable element-derived protein 4-like [Eriocheir sinensis]|uniref:piggyBac transposable element-derived protein 4-like n=1 Tax=Eriocheir sinensis TaxID=95602 RepID=UPI0021CA50CA|nr:piggyBac transposable element-derived protein 4-like [Eriocheir sinensis]